MRETKRVYDGTLYNVFIGTNETALGAQKQTVASKNAATPELEAKLIAEKLANILVEMGDYNRDYNDYGFLRSYGEDAIKVIWNSKFVNKIRKIDLPAIFHKEDERRRRSCQRRPAHLSYGVDSPAISPWR